MQREARNQQINQLKQNGFKMVKDYPYLYINETGNVYSLRTGEYLKPDHRNTIKAESQRLSVPKLILQTFKGKTYKAGQIVYIDGNKANTTAQNIKYSRLYEPGKTIEVNQTDLMTALRCYSKVKKRYNTKDRIQTRLFLLHIIGERGFFIDNYKKPYIEVFKTYIEGIQNSVSATAKKHGLTVRDCSIIVNGFLNQLITDILQDLKSGILSIKEFEPPRKRKLTTKQILKEWQTEMNEIKNSPKA